MLICFFFERLNIFTKDNLTIQTKGLEILRIFFLSAIKICDLLFPGPDLNQMGDLH